MNFEFVKENNMFICANNFFKLVGTKWDCSPNSKNSFINIAIFYDDDVDYFDINIFTDNDLTIENFSNYCNKVFSMHVEFHQIYDFMKAMTKCAFTTFEANSISTFCRRKRLLTKPAIICYANSLNGDDAFDVIAETTTPPLDYPGTRRDAS